MNIKGRFSATCALVFMLLPLGACDEEPIAPGANPGLEFTYDGARSGIYRSEAGSPATSPEGLPEFGSWSVARPDSLGGLVIAGFAPTGANEGDVFILQLDDIRVGSFEPCNVFGGGGCHGRFFVGVILDDLASLTFEEYFEIVDGRVDITEDPRHVRGFAGEPGWEPHDHGHGRRDRRALVQRALRGRQHRLPCPEPPGGHQRSLLRRSPPPTDRSL